jgi:aryl-alcohol dehydrogenase-like predicted oxidoreductase
VKGALENSMNENVERRRLGSSGPVVTPIGLGCWQFSKGRGMAGRFWPVLGDGTIREIVRVSLENGVNWFDTAETYGKGESEKALARSLGELGVDRNDVVIATKWWPILRFSGSITTTIDERLSCLGTDRIDLHQIHFPRTFASRKSEMREMARLLDEGKILAAGVSNYSAGQMREAADELERLGHRLATNQVDYSLMNRKMESNGVLETARDRGMSIIAYSPLAQGVLSGRFHDDPASTGRIRGIRKHRRIYSRRSLEDSKPLVDALRAIGSEHDATPAQTALAWTIRYHGDTVVAIPGATRAGQAEDNARAMRVVLTGGEMEKIDELSRRYR